MCPINTQINDLENTEKMIEELSTQIKSNVNKINDDFLKTDRFKSLVDAICGQICSDITRIKNLNKKNDIEQDLCNKLKEIQKQVVAKRSEIVKKLQDHEEKTRKKIYDHTKLIMPELYTFYHGPDPEASRLKEKIKTLLSGERSLEKFHDWINLSAPDLGQYLSYIDVLQNPSVPMPRKYNDQILELIDSIRLMYSRRSVLVGLVVYHPKYH